MKVVPLLLAVSLLANATLAVLIWHPSAAVSADSEQRRTSFSPGTLSAKEGPRLSPAAAAAFTDDNPEALRDLLRASGLSEEMVRAIVQMRLWKKYESRFKANSPQSAESAANQAWWKDDRDQQNGWNKRQTKAQRDETRRLQRELKDESERLLGVDPNQNRWQSQQFAFLAPEKRQSLLDIQQDYQELIGEVQQDSQGFRLASDEEKLRYLQAEQKRDLEALMTPAERQAYELRQSPTAQQLRGKMTLLNASEQEYLTIFPLQKAFDEKYNPQLSDPFGPGPERDQKYWKERREAEAQLQNQIKSVVGEARFAESVRQQDYDWRQLEAATRRLTLPADTPARIYALRDTTAVAAQQIADNPSMAADQKKQALAELAAGARAQVRAGLGDDGASAYFKSNGMRWLQELERGNTVSFNSLDSNWSSKPLPKDSKKSVGK